MQLHTEAPAGTSPIVPHDMPDTAVDWHVGDERPLPLIGTPRGGPRGGPWLQRWLEAHSGDVDSRLGRHGALLFRGFGVETLEEFQAIAGVLCRSLGDYVGGNSPRTQVASHVFTATEYPRQAEISLHNEASYLKVMPRRVLFYCRRPAATGGATPLADCRRVLARIDPDVRARFEAHGVEYISNMHAGAGFGRSWADVFRTRERAEVERRLRADGYRFEWTRDSGLRSAMTAPATVTHPDTGEAVWINQAEQWHPSSLGVAMHQQLVSVLGQDGLPHNARLGDGTPLRDDDLRNIRQAMAAEQRVFPWQAGDVLLCDNLLVMHGRQPFSGDREVFVAMD